MWLIQWFNSPPQCRVSSVMILPPHINLTTVYIHLSSFPVQGRAGDCPSMLWVRDSAPRQITIHTPVHLIFMCLDCGRKLETLSEGVNSTLKDAGLWTDCQIWNQDLVSLRQQLTTCVFTKYCACSEWADCCASSIASCSFLKKHSSKLANDTAQGYQNVSIKTEMSWCVISCNQPPFRKIGESINPTLSPHGSGHNAL